MRVLIVGCGYVGLPLGAELVRRGHQVWGVRRSQEAQAKLSSAGITPLLADISVPESIEGLPGGWDWVVHCVSASGGSPEDYRRTYLEGTRNLLNRLRLEPPKRFIYTSSTGVYGQNDGFTVDETSATVPEAETAKVLVQTEQLVLKAEVSPVILRLAGIYGPGRGYWLKSFLSGEARIEDRGERILNMVHRDDVIGAMIAALERGRPGEVYNVADDEPVSQLALFEWLAKHLGSPLPPLASKHTERKRASTNKRVSNRKLRQELGYQLKFPTFRQGFTAELAESPGRAGDTD